MLPKRDNSHYPPKERWLGTCGGSATPYSCSDSSMLFTYTSSSVSTPTESTSSSYSANVASTSTSVSPDGLDMTSSVTVPTTITLPTTTFTTSIIEMTLIQQPTTSYTYSLVPSTHPANRDIAHDVCVGHGVDSLSLGVMSTLIFSVGVGFVIWLLFAVVRPRIREIYALREWFLRPDLRPPSLGNGLLSFLHPPVPMVPPLPGDVSGFGGSPAADARLFPSDDELIQRTIRKAFLLVLGWTLIGLVIVVPLYMVDTPCFGRTITSPQYTGEYSALQDLSVLRLLRLLENESINTSVQTRSITTLSSGLYKRLIVNGTDEAHKARGRLLALTVILLVLSVLPALNKLLREFNALVAYRKRWLSLRCEGYEMGWLSRDKVPGLDGMGEKEVKDMIVKYGLSTLLEEPSESWQRRRREEIERRYRMSTPMDDANGSLASPAQSQEGGAEIDITGIFSIVDTKELSRLVQTRAIVLNHLEQAECLYIDSFRASGHDAFPSAESDVVSVVESPTPLEPTPPERRISRPRPLRSSRHPLGRKSTVSASRPPTTYMAPSSYYRLRGIRRVSDAGDGHGRHATDGALSSEFGQRIASPRIPESPLRQSVTFRHPPPSSHARSDRSGPFHLTQGPNYGEPDPEEEAQWLEHEGWDVMPDRLRVPEILERQSFLSRLGLGLPPRGSRLVAYRDNISEESFMSPHDSSEDRHVAARNLDFGAEIEPLDESVASTPPRLRLQQPTVRPVSGLHQEHLASLYDDIRRWRSQLKALNIEIEDQQRAAFDRITRGQNVRGWLLVGKGIRFLPSIRMIEGRSKDDIRWEDLQHDGGVIGRISFWIIVCVVATVLAGALVPVLGLALANAPDFAFYVPVLKPLTGYNRLWPSIATTLLPAIAASLLMCIAIGLVHYAAKFSGSVSNSETRLMTLKGTFYITVVVAGAWLVGVSSILFSINSFKNDSGQTRSVSRGAIYIATFCMCLGLVAAFIGPGLLLLQPVRLLRVIGAQWRAITPRQTFRAVYPRPYNPSFGMAACILAVFFAATFSLLFPLIGPPLVILLFLTLVAHRYLVGYVYGRVERGQSGGLLHIWLIRRFATMVSLQPLLLGLLLLAYRMWALAWVLLGAAVFIIVFVEAYCTFKLRNPGIRSLSNTTRDCLEEFSHVITSAALKEDDEKSLPYVPRSRSIPDLSRTTSMASFLDMISSTLAVTPSRRVKGPVPLPTESIDDLISTARAAATNPDTPPQLNPHDPADDFADLLYPPETLAPPPAIWLLNDPAGVGRSEAADLGRFHHLDAVLDTPPARQPGNTR